MSYTTPMFAEPTANENLVPGWNVQGNISGDGQTGYAQEGNVAPVSGSATVGQAGAGYPNPPLAMDIDAEASGAYTESALTNGSYTYPVTTAIGTTVNGPVVTTAGVQSPFGTASVAYLTLPAGVTEVTVNSAVVWSGTSTAGQQVLINVDAPGATVATVGGDATATSWSSTL